VYERPPKREGICDIDGSELIHRPDDKEAVIRGRMAIYDAQTKPLVDYYRERGLLNSVDAMADADVVTAEIRKILDGARASNDCL
jgi:adenylate kinase